MPHKLKSSPLTIAHFNRKIAILTLISLIILLANQLMAEEFHWGQSVKGFPPFHMPKGSAQKGIYNEMIDEIGKKTGDTFIVHYYPARRGISYFDQGRVDLEVMVSPVWWGDNPPTNSVWSVPVFYAADIFIFHPSVQLDLSQGFESLKDTRVATVGGYRYGENEPFIRDDGPNDISTIKKVDSHRVGVGLMNEYVAKYLAKELDLNVTFGPTFIEGEMVIRIHKSKIHTVPRINQAITELKEDGTFQRIIDSYIHE
ncbi:MAG: hypothetical protein D6B25_14740 [Desulfobulbaceae bacterium]|nr:MAG: hypothetical protein D6B25_14740 [Desulfobulbaceae bacterium]